LVAVAFVVFYVGLYFWGTNSEGYRFLDRAVRNSPAIHQLLGDVQSVRLSFLGGYSEKFVNSESTKSKTEAMTLNVVGSKRALDVKAIAKETNGTWTVSDASIDGQQINLN
jgi:hypothetical protein